jgi:hypothetical protein
MSIITRLQSSGLHDYSLQVDISQHDRSHPPSESPNSINYSLEEHLQTCSIMISMMACKCNYKLSPSNSASLGSLDHSLEVYLQIHSITASKFVAKLARSHRQSVSLSLLHCLYQKLLKLLSSTACSQSRHAVCRWVAILIHRYIDQNTN